VQESSSEPFPSPFAGETVVDDRKLEEEILRNLRSFQNDISSVDCPSDVEVIPGTTFKCVVHTEAGSSETATLKILNHSADLRLVSLGSNK
jgi:hypothetical protein